MNERDGGRGLWGKALAAGCGCLMLIVIVAVMLIGWNWPKLSGIASEVKGTFSEMQTVQAALQAEYGAAGGTFVQYARRSGTAGPILSIRLVNVPGLEDLPREALERKALEIAAFARDRMKPEGGWNDFEVILSTRSGEGLSYTSDQTFRFSSDQLPPRSPVPPPAVPPEPAPGQSAPG